METPISRRSFLKTAAVAGAAGGMFPYVGKSSAAARPNVLFIAVDDLRPQLGCYGHQFMQSPNIDSLGSSGTVFSRAYCQVPVCGASRASLMSGIRPTRHRFVDYYAHIDEDLPGGETLPHLFRTNGYHTVSNGKIYHYPADDPDGWSEKPWRPRGSWVGRGYIDPDNQAMARQTDFGGRGPSWEAPDVPDNTYMDGLIAEKTIADLNRLNNQEQPFFLATGFMKPHLPFNAPKRYWDRYRRDNIDLADNPFRPKGAPDSAMHNWVELRNYVGIPPEGPLTEEMTRTLVHGYYACVSYVDAQIGKVIAELDRLGLRDSTIVVLWGDHGWSLGEHGLWCKHCNFETALHSPLIVRAPGYAPGETQALVEFVDIFPSLCEHAGLSVPDQLQGLSFVPLMENPRRNWKTAAFSRYFDGDSVRTDRYRYTEWRRENLVPGLAYATEEYSRMLYDHSVDPGENVNVAEDSANASVVERLSAVIENGWKAALPG